MHQSENINHKLITMTNRDEYSWLILLCAYLGSTLSRVVHIDDEVNARIAKASAAFGRLRGSIWDRSGIRLDTKLKVYRSVVLPTLLYACETWTVYQRHAKKLNHFHTSSSDLSCSICNRQFGAKIGLISHLRTHK